MTAEELYEKFSTGKKPNGDDFKELIDFRGKDGADGAKGDKGEKGDKGADGTKGADGKNGASVKSIALTVDVDGKVTGDTATLTDNTTAPITVA